MKKKLCATFLTLLALMVFATSVFAAEARWRNVTKITPIILASTNTYSSVINGSEGTTKIDCTLILYEKNQSGTYSEISRFLPDETMNKLFTGADGETLYTDDGYQYKLSTMPWCQDGTCKR